MNSPTTGDDIASLARSGGQLADQALVATRRAVHNGADQLAQAAEDVRAQGSSTIQSLVHGTEDLTRHGIEAIRDRSLQVRDATSSYVQHKPVTALLMAAATGAVLTGLFVLLARRNGSGH